MTARTLIAAFLAAGSALAQPVAANAPTACVHTEMRGARPFTWGPTSTVWTATETATSTVDCGGCASAVYRYLPMGPGPVVFFDTTVTAATPTTTTTVACSATPAGDDA